MTFPQPTPRAIGLILGLIVMAFLAFYIPSCLQKQRSQRAQARVDASQAQAASESAKDAIGTVARSGEAQAASEQLTRDNERAIREAPGADAKVSGEVQQAGLVALCRRESYRNAPRCAAFR